MSKSNRERVTTALNHFVEATAPFVEREMNAQYKDQWKKKVEEILRNNPGGHRKPTAGGVLHWDTAAIIDVILTEWHYVFRKKLGKSERSMLHELSDVRNNWAHQEHFSTDDTMRALDTIQRLLTSVSAREADYVYKMLREVIRETVREEEGKSAQDAVAEQPPGKLKSQREGPSLVANDVARGGGGMLDSQHEHSKSGRPPVWQMLREAAKALGPMTTNVAVRDWILKHYPSTKKNTISAHIILCTVNHPSRVHYPQHARQQLANPQKKYDFLFRPARGELELYDPAKHGQWEIRKRKDDHLEVGLVGNQRAEFLADDAGDLRAQVSWRSFLAPAQLGLALRAYARFAKNRKNRGWLVSDKAYLYRLAETGFDSDNPQPDPFAEIDAKLRAHWKVARNGTVWPALKTFGVLTSSRCQRCSRGELDLATLGNADDLGVLWQCLTGMSGIKTLESGEVSPMAVSKFLHFFNPRLFPVFDRKVIENWALPLFRGERRQSRERWEAATSPFAQDPLFGRGLGKYLYYILWAADCFASVSTKKTMTVFVRSFHEMLQAEGQGARPPKQIRLNFATAFEFALIGASSRAKSVE